MYTRTYNLGGIGVKRKSSSLFRQVEFSAHNQVLHCFFNSMSSLC